MDSVQTTKFLSKLNQENIVVLIWAKSRARLQWNKIETGLRIHNLAQNSFGYEFVKIVLEIKKQ